EIGGDRRRSRVRVAKRPVVHGVRVGGVREEGASLRIEGMEADGPLDLDAAFDAAEGPIAGERSEVLPLGEDDDTDLRAVVGRLPEACTQHHRVYLLELPGGPARVG